jgi:hypothetical protein
MLKAENTNLNKSISGFIKVWKTSPTSGKSELVVDQPNLVLTNGAKLLAYALGGKENAKIWGMYIGFNNNALGQFTRPTIDIQYSSPFDALSNDFGYLREPLTFTPSYYSDPGYQDNTVLFSTMITSATSAHGASFTNSVSRIYEVALVAALDPNNSSRDIVFSRTGFNSILYDSNFNFTVTWGIKFLVD